MEQSNMIQQPNIMQTGNSYLDQLQGIQQQIQNLQNIQQLYMPQNAQNFQQQLQPQQTAPQPERQLSYVKGVSGAKIFPLKPNESVTLYDDSREIFFTKTADSNGIVTLKAFEYKEIDMESIVEKNVKYATTDDINSLHKEIEELKGLMKNGQSNNEFTNRKQSK